MIARPPRTPPTPIPITLSKVLLVEGQTPAHFFEALLQHLQLSEQVEIRDFGGVNALREYLRALALSSDFRETVKSLGVARDAETDAVTARQSVDDALAAAELAHDVKTSVFILPDNSRPGMIETLCLDSVRDEPVYRCVEEFFECAKNQGIKVPDPPNNAKSYAQAFLSTREDVQLFPGLAASRGYWPWDNPVLNDLKEFLRAL